MLLGMEEYTDIVQLCAFLCVSLCRITQVISSLLFEKEIWLIEEEVGTLTGEDGRSVGIRMSTSFA